MLKGPYDIGLVEGSVITHGDAERIQEVRRKCKSLITIGACATAGGIQALRNWKDVDEFIRVVYASPQYINTLKLSTPIAEHVPVDFELRGCPINKYQLVELISATLGGAKAEHSHVQRLHRMQAQGERVHRGSARDRMPGAGYPGRLRCALPKLRPRLLRLLWTYGNAQPRCLDGTIPHSRAVERPDPARVPRVQRVGMAVPRGERGVSTEMTGTTRTIKVDTLARVEGEGSLYIKLVGERVTDVKLKIFEPPRMFEAFMRDRHFSEAPTLRRASAGSVRSLTR